MDKYLFLFLFILLRIQVSAQELKGKYVDLDDYSFGDNTTYIFNKDGSFEYIFSTDNWENNKYGMGHYTVHKNKLILNFEAFTPPESKANIEIFEPVEDSVIIIIDVKTANDNYALSGAEILVLNKSGDIIRKYFTNAEGKARLSLKDNKAAQEIQIKYIGLSTFKYKLLDKCIGLSVEMKTQYPKLVSSHTNLEYLMKVDDDILKLKANKKEAYKVYHKKE